METQFLFWGGGFIISVIVFYLIIQAATDSNRKSRLQESQVKLLALMATALGVSEDKINEIKKNAGIKD